ncbi:MAG: hypothetical protein KBF73_12075 [Flavobacteriales bacterium]|nr:hypothetical protein [Flavobacteriales bacterium]
MQEVVVKYKNKKALNALLDLSKYFDFSIVLPSKKKEADHGVTVIPADDSVDISELNAVFSDRKLDASELRKKAWQRDK